MAPKRKPPAPAGLRNRIVGHGAADPKTLTANPLNFRTHPAHQMAVLDAAVSEIGWVQEVVVNKRTGRILDGHARVKMAIAKGEGQVPVTWIDVDPAEEAKIIATLDPIAALAEHDPEILRLALEQVHTTSPEIMGLLEGLSRDAGLDEALAQAEHVPMEQESPEIQGAFTLRGPETILSASNVEGIPDLLPEHLATPDELNLDRLRTWAGNSVTPDDGNSWFLYQWGSDSQVGLPYDRTVVGFYVDDHRFHGFRPFLGAMDTGAEPEKFVGKMLNKGIFFALTPNFSMLADRPRIERRTAVHAARWAGRYMQEAGIKIVPDINFADRSDFEFCLLGIPPEPPLVAVEIQSSSKAEATQRLLADGLKIIEDRLKPQGWLFYGSEKARPIVKSYGLSAPHHFVVNRSQVAREGRLNRQRESETGAIR